MTRLCQGAQRLSQTPMNALKDRRVVAAVGGGGAVLLALLFGVFALHGHKSDTDDGASKPAAGALQVEQGAADSSSMATRPLRCFVNGQFIGMAPVAECAKKNGVAAQALDVGLDPATGQVTAASGSLAPQVQPMPAPAPDQGDQTDATLPPATAPGVSAASAAPSAPAPVGDCLKFAQDGWHKVGAGVSLGQCARTLFDGHCAAPGAAQYGRWATNTLRLAQGRVDISPDNRTFRPLIPQNPQDCSLPPA